MAKISKSILVLFVVTLCIVLPTDRSTGPTAEAQAKIEDPYHDVCVLVEAFVVEVDLSSLYKQVENILKCLDTRDIAQVTTGIKVAILSGQRGEAKITETIYVERQVAVPSGRKVPGAARYTNYDIGKTFRATVSVRPSGEILASFDFSESTYRNIISTDEAPPNIVSREWSGTVNLHAGRPAIAGATQNEETAVFLILCADIKGR